MAKTRKQFSGRSLITKAGLAASGLSMAVVLFASALSFWVARNQILHSISVEMDNRADQISTHISNSIQNVLGTLAAMAQNKLMANALVDSMGRDNYLRPYLNSIEKINDLQVKITLSDHAGRAIATNNVRPDWGHDRELSQSAIDSNNPQFRVTTHDGKVLLAVAWPVLYANTGLPEGSVSYRFEFDDILEQIVASDGVMSGFVVHLTPPGVQEMLSISQDAPMPQDTYSAQKSISMPGVLSSLAANVQVWTDKSFYRNNIRTMLTGYATIAIFGTLVIVPLGMVMTRRMLGRLRKIEQVAAIVVNTKSLEQEFPEGGNDEIASLAKAFNIMLADLKQAQNELRSEANREIRQHALRTKRILARTTEGYLRINVRTGKVIEVNQSFCDMMGMDCETWKDQPSPVYLQELVAKAAKSDSVISFEPEDVEIKNEDQPTKTMLIHASLDIDEEGEKHLVVFLTDISLRKIAERNLQTANARLTVMVEMLHSRDLELTALNSMNDLLLAAENDAEAYQVIEQMAPSIFGNISGALAIMQHDGKTLEVSAQWGETGLCLKRFELTDCWAMRQGRMFEMSMDGCIRCAHVAKDGPTDYVCIPLTVKGKSKGLVWSQIRLDHVDVVETVKKTVNSFAESVKMALSNLELRETLKRQATRDALTGLYNRRTLSEMLVKEMALADRASLPLMLALFDLDHFKSINDQYGHQAGDIVLVRFAALLRERSRKSDFIFRIGGEEFLLLLPNTDTDGAVQCVESIRQALAQTLIAFQGNTSAKVTVSVGLAGYPAHGRGEEELLGAADGALYQAKQGGRNTFRIASVK